MHAVRNLCEGVLGVYDQNRAAVYVLKLISSHLRRRIQALLVLYS